MQHIETGGIANMAFAKHISAHVENAIKRFEKVGDAEPIPTGLLGIDREIGGLLPGELIIVGGRPGMGKTGLGLAISKELAANLKPVVFFSLGKESGDHLAARLCNILSMKEEVAGQRTLEDWQAWYIKSQADICRQLPLYIDDSPNIGADELCRRIRVHHENAGKMNLVVVENLHLLCAAEGIAQSKWPFRLVEISTQLKALAEQLQITILANTSLRRKLERRNNKRPFLSDMPADFRRQADLIFLLYRDGPYSGRWDDDSACITIAWYKGRPVSQRYYEKWVYLKFDPECGMFTDVDYS